MSVFRGRRDFLFLFLLISVFLLQVQCQSHNKTNGSDFTFLISGGFRSPEKMAFVSYMVSLRTRYPEKYFGDNHFCAGSIISPRVVVTAAHCVMDKRKVLTRPRRLLVVGGSPNRLNHENTTIQFPVDSIKAHRNYILYNSNDIALVRLKQHIPTNSDRMKIIPLPTSQAPYGVDCTTLGWGRMYYNGPLSATAMHVDVKIYTPEECKKKAPRVIKGMLCAGDQKNYDEDPCRGDSGGPLICNGVLVGITSWTIGCGSRRYPSLYTNVYEHLNWIKANLDGTNRVQMPSLLLLILSLIFVLI